MIGKILKGAVLVGVGLAIGLPLWGLLAENLDEIGEGKGEYL